MAKNARIRNKRKVAEFEEKIRILEHNQGLILERQNQLFEIQNKSADRINKNFITIQEEFNKLAYLAAQAPDKATNKRWWQIWKQKAYKKI